MLFLLTFLELSKQSHQQTGQTSSLLNGDVLVVVYFASDYWCCCFCYVVVDFSSELSTL